MTDPTCSRCGVRVSEHPAGRCLLTCKTCDGTGHIWDIEVAASGDNGYMGKCKTCGGAGYVSRAALSALGEK